MIDRRGQFKSSDKVYGFLKSLIFVILFFLVASCSSHEKGPRTFANFNQCGYSVGQLMCEVKLYDQYNNLRSLNDLNGIKILQFSTMWCSPCQEAAHKSLQLKRLYESALSYAVILLESYDAGAEPSNGDIRQWAHDLELPYNVFQGHDELIDMYEETGFRVEFFPTYYIISNDNIILNKAHSSEELQNYLDTHVFGVPLKGKPAPSTNTSSSSISSSSSGQSCMPEEVNE